MGWFVRGLGMVAVFGVWLGGRAALAAEAQRPSGITVTGECLTKVVQDRGSVTVASTARSKISREASERVIKAHEEVRAAVKKLGLKDFVAETAGFSVFEECSYPDGKKVCTGYQARLATRFETSEIGRLGDIIGSAAELGAEEVSSLEMLVSPALMQREREACLERATQNAFSKATKIAAGAGVKLGRTVSIVEGMGGGGVVTPMAEAYSLRSAPMAAAEASGPTVEARPVDVQLVVTANYAIE